MKRDRFTCTYCGTTGAEAELEIDHIVAVARGGSHHISNLTTACRRCNREKGANPATPRPTTDRPASSPAHPLVGMFFHTFDEADEINFQAHVLAVDDETVIAQMFSWMSGDPTNVQTFEKSFLYSSRCKLYRTREAWLDGYERHCQRRRLRAERSASHFSAET